MQFRYLELDFDLAIRIKSYVLSYRLMYPVYVLCSLYNKVCFYFFVIFDDLF